MPVYEILKNDLGKYRVMWTGTDEEYELNKFVHKNRDETFPFPREPYPFSKRCWEYFIDWEKYNKMSDYMSERHSSSYPEMDKRDSRWAKEYDSEKQAKIDIKEHQKTVKKYKKTVFKKYGRIL